MEKALQLYLNTNTTLLEAAKQFGVPVSTLHTRYPKIKTRFTHHWKRIKEIVNYLDITYFVIFRAKGREICPRMGAPTVFSEDEERLMHEFLLDAWFLRIPRTMNQFSHDIQFMLDLEQRRTKFTLNKPGKLIFGYYCKICILVKF